MRLVDLHAEWDEIWAKAIAEEHRFPPYWWLRSVTADSRRRLLDAELDERLADNEALMLGVLVGQTPVGFAAAHRLDWDSRHFGLPVWRLTHLGAWGNAGQRRAVACALVAAVRRRAGRRGARTIHTWLPLDDLPLIHVLEGNGYRVMESQMLWYFDLQRWPLPLQKGTAVIRPHRAEDEAAIIDLARHVYTSTPDRFHADPHLPKKACDDLYACWMRNSLRGEAADFVAVVEVDGVFAGYGSLRYPGDQGGLCNVRVAQFLLGALAPEFRRSGAHDDLMAGMLAWLLAQDADVAYVGTQTNNIAAQTGMARQGWRPVRGGLSLHLWLGGDGDC